MFASINFCNFQMARGIPILASRPRHTADFSIEAHCVIASG